LKVKGVSTSAEVDKGRCPFEPGKLLKKFDQNFINHLPKQKTIPKDGFFMFDLII